MQPNLITTQRDLNQLCASWREAGWFSFDTEFIRDDTFEAHLCLIQVNGIEDDVILIDPTAPRLNLAPFWEIVTDPEVITIVHAGKEDFEVCLRACGQPPRNVFDIQIAAGFTGYGYPMSLSRIVELVMRRKLRKGQTLTDWARRPLTDEQIRYAIEDVAHLPEIYRRLSRKLNELGRTAWAREEFARYESPEFYIPPAGDRVQKLKGSKNLDALGLLVLERLIEWRDQWAKEKNRPVRALIRDDVLVEVARRRPKQAQELAVLRGFPQSKNARVVNQVISILDDARNVPRSQLPKPVKVREQTPMLKSTIDLLSAVSRALSFENNISHELVGTAQRLRELVDFDLGYVQETPPLLQGWRKQFIGQRLLDLLKGRCEIHFSGWPDSPRLDVLEVASGEPVPPRKRRTKSTKKAKPKPEATT
ncbi:MAG: ribonuclease D [Phycisphaerae bacterium]